MRAGLVRAAKEWPWSSHRETIGQLPRSLADPSPVALPAHWVQYVNQPLTGEDLTALRRSVNRQSPYGSSAWQEEVSIEYGLQSTLRARGRPKKSSLSPFREEM